MQSIAESPPHSRDTDPEENGKNHDLTLCLNFHTRTPVFPHAGGVLKINFRREITSSPFKHFKSVSVCAEFSSVKSCLAFAPFSFLPLDAASREG